MEIIPLNIRERNRMVCDQNAGCVIYLCWTGPSVPQLSSALLALPTPLRQFGIFLSRASGLKVDSDGLRGGMTGTSQL